MTDPTAPEPFGSPRPPGDEPPPPAAPTPPGAGYPPPTSGPGYVPPNYEPPTSGPGYPQPGSGGPYPPQGGYQPPGYTQPNSYGQPGGYPPAGASMSETQTWVLIAHFGGAAGVLISGTFAGWVAPLVAFLAKGPTDPVVRSHSLEALNFHLTWAAANVAAWILYLCGGILTFSIGFFILWVLPLATFLIALVFGIIGGVKASNGELYRYPLSVRLVK